MNKTQYECRSVEILAMQTGPGSVHLYARPATTSVENKTRYRAVACVRLRIGYQLRHDDLAALCGRMVEWLVASGRFRPAVPRGLSWSEVGGPAGSASPSGGPQGESQVADGDMPMDPLPGLDSMCYHQDAATPREARKAPRHSRGSVIGSKAG